MVGAAIAEVGEHVADGVEAGAEMDAVEVAVADRAVRDRHAAVGAARIVDPDLRVRAAVVGGVPVVAVVVEQDVGVDEEAEEGERLEEVAAFDLRRIANGGQIETVARLDKAVAVGCERLDLVRVQFEAEGGGSVGERGRDRGETFPGRFRQTWRRR